MIFGSAALLAAAGCGRPQSELLTQARAAYQQAEQTPDIRARAPVELNAAQQSLQQAQQAYDDGKNIDDVNALAYVAQRKVQVARQAAREKQAEEDIQRLSGQTPPANPTAGTSGRQPTPQAPY
jgi:hypothetical protein